MDWNHALQSALKSESAWLQFIERQLEANPHRKDWIEWTLDQKKNLPSTFPLFILPSLAQEIWKLGPHSPLAKEFLPSVLERDEAIQHKGLLDPIGDLTFQKADGLVHRYENRCLILPLSFCPVHCRFCFRRNEFQTSKNLFKIDFQDMAHYLSLHPEIDEVILTGGDPLLLSNKKIEMIFKFLSEIDSLKVIRFHSRVLPFLPERILESDFISLLKLWQNRFQFVIGVHTNHLSEWFHPQAANAIEVLRQLNITLLSQTVLLKDINNETESLKLLFQYLATLHIQPYYLHHPDLVHGAMHFWMDLDQGQQIYGTLKKQISSWMLPKYVVDLSQLGGKQLVENLKLNQWDMANNRQV